MADKVLRNGEVVQAVRDNVYGMDRFKQVQSLRDMTEAVPETPMVQIYWNGTEQSRNSNTGRATFGNRAALPLRIREVVVHVDIYATVRADIGRDMELIQDLADDLEIFLDQQLEAPFFGLEGIQAFSFRGERVLFEYNKKNYQGARYVLTFTLF